MFSFDDFLARAKRNLLKEPAQGRDRSDDDMNEKARLIPPDVPATPAAVLIAIVKRAEPKILLTQRHSGLAKHAGQIAFPGGRADEGETALDAALRETEEEVGLSQQFITPIGYLSNYLTVTNYLITPVVAEVAPGFALSLQVDEVDEAFEVPLAFLMDSANCQRRGREWQGITRYYYVYQFAERHVWGATAGMIRNLHDTLYR